MPRHLQNQSNIQMADKKENPILVSESYIHEKSEFVPDLVKKLDDLKNKIRSNLINHTSEKIDGIKFCHPFDVPPTKD